MSRYHVIRPGTGLPSSLEWVAAALVLAAIVVLVSPLFVSVPVYVDGQLVTVAYGAPAGLLVEQGLTRNGPGDVIAAGDRSVVVPGAGGPPQIVRDGVLLTADDPLRVGDRIASEPGLDIVESTITTRTPIPMPVEVKGRGPLLLLAQAGSVGIMEQVIGAESGQVISEREIEPPTPMVMRRTGFNAKVKLVALTFDDGPWPGQTQDILRILEREQVPATFFMIGSQVEAHPELAELVKDKGHLIANHSMRHPDLSRASWDRIAWELRESQAVIKKATGLTPTWFRPPMGRVDQRVYDIARKKNLKLVLWTVDPQDWRKPLSYVLADEVVSSVRPGDVILLHDGGGVRTKTIKALPTIIRRLKAQGYQFVTLDQLGEAAL